MRAFCRQARRSVCSSVALPLYTTELANRKRILLEQAESLIYIKKIGNYTFFVNIFYLYNVNSRRLFLYTTSNFNKRTVLRQPYAGTPLLKNLKR